MPLATFKAWKSGISEFSLSASLIQVYAEMTIQSHWQLAHANTITALTQ